MTVELRAVGRDLYDVYDGGTFIGTLERPVAGGPWRGFYVGLAIDSPPQPTKSAALDWFRAVGR